jgi:hypothetical protein
MSLSGDRMLLDGAVSMSKGTPGMNEEMAQTA